MPVPRSVFSPSPAHWLLCLIVVGGFNAAASTAEPPGSEVYLADFHRSEWRFSGSGALCELTHEIPQFGMARFQRLAGEALTFRLDAFQPVPERIEGVMREVSPPWSPTEADSLEQIVTVAPGMHPIQLDRRPAGWLLSTLAKGQLGSFEMLDWNDSRKLRRIQLSPVNFQTAYRQFKHCVEERKTGGFQSLQTSTVLFALDVDRLDEEAKAALTGLADYVKADGRIKAVQISGHADDQGAARYNLRLSARRAKGVYDYLAQQGVETKLLSRRHYGESRPRMPGRTQAARAANRRAEIELVR